MDTNTQDKDSSKQTLAAELEHDEEETVIESQEPEEEVELSDRRPLLPLQLNRRAWVTLAVILAAIVVVMVYVYTSGNPKTTLGNRAVPAGQTAAFQAPNRAVVPAYPPAARAATGPATVKCPQCQMQGVPLCSACGSVMQPLVGNGASGLFVCPSCGTVGLPLCPHDKSPMTMVR